MITTILVIIAIALAVAIAAALIYASIQPDTFRVIRSTQIAAPADKIFPLINDLHAQSAWSPFEKDPNMKRTHSGAPAGKGAVYEWDGNRNVGAGRIAITDSVPSSRVSLALDMSRPFAAHNTVDFILEQKGAGTNVTGTQVTWAMQGRQHFMVKLMSMFVSCDKMVGGQFEEGLGKLKTLVEAQATHVAAE
jgi:Polyketide cyclase / dehydrase and lipid transport